jgi:hypothetical protein
VFAVRFDTIWLQSNWKVRIVALRLPAALLKHELTSALWMDYRNNESGGDRNRQEASEEEA